MELKNQCVSNTICFGFCEYYYDHCYAVEWVEMSCYEFCWLDLNLGVRMNAMNVVMIAVNDDHDDEIDDHR